MKPGPLTPLKTSSQRRKLKQLRAKQNNWVLDCLNREKSKLKPYSSFKDKYLKYFVIGLPKKKRVYQKQKEILQKTIDSNHFKNFLQKKKKQILNNNQSDGALKKKKLSKTEQDISRNNIAQNCSFQNKNLGNENQECSKKKLTEQKKKSIDLEDLNSMLIKEQCSNIELFISKVFQDEFAEKYVNIEHELNQETEQNMHPLSYNQQRNRGQNKKEENESIGDEKPIPITIQINEVQTPKSIQSINDEATQIEKIHQYNQLGSKKLINQKLNLEKTSQKDDQLVVQF